MNSAGNNFFEGLKVVELASVLAGPATALFFHELGARVIKVENKRTGGDVTRSWKLSTEDKSSSFSAYYFSVNCGKETLFADFRNEEDLNKIKELIAGSDIVIANFKQGDAEKYGLGYEELCKLKADLIYAAINGFGDGDERVAYDLILQAESGFMSMNGTPESGPLKMPVALIDILAAHQLKEAILLALLQKLKTGKGSHVSVSLFETAVASLVNQASNYLNAATLPQLTGSLHPNIAPYGEIFTTADNFAVTFAVGSDAQFERLITVLKIQDKALANLFGNNQLRVQNRKLLYPIISDAVSSLSLKQLKEFCIDGKIPFAQIKNLKEVLEDKELKDNLIRAIMVNGKPVYFIKSFVAAISINK